MPITAVPDDLSDQIEDHLDCAGNRRTFRLRLQPSGLFLEAVEQTGEAAGRRFMLPVPIDGPEPWGELRTRIRQRLSQRDVVRDEHGRLEILNGLVRAQITSRDGEPSFLVDDMELTWDEIGSLLTSYEGWGLRIEIRSCGDE